MVGQTEPQHNPPNANVGEPLDRHRKLLRDFQELDQAIKLLPTTSTASLVASYRPFIEILYARTPPTWPQVRSILIDIFGELDEDKDQEQEIPLGVNGIQALREAIGRAIGGDRDVGAVRHWLDLIERSVLHTHQVIARNPMESDPPPQPNGASSRSQGRNSSVPANSPNSTRSEPNVIANNGTGAPFESARSTSPARSQSLSVNPNLETTEQPVCPRRGRATSKRLRERAVSPEPFPEEKPERQLSARKRNKGKGRLDESNETDTKDKGKRREGQGQMKKRVPRSTCGGGEIDKDGRNQSETPPKVLHTPDLELRHDRGAPAILPPRLSPEEQLVRSVFPSIPADINLSSSLMPCPPPMDLEIAFRRSDIGGNKQWMHNPGTQGKQYAQHRNHLSITTTLNLCGFAASTGDTPRPFAPGEPIVIPIEISAQNVLAVFAPKPKLGKHRPVANVWIKKQENAWLYRGLYEIAHDGSEGEQVQYLPVPTGSKGKVGIHPELRRLVGEHLKKKSKDSRTAEQVLEDWGFEARDREAALVEMGTQDQGDRGKHVKFLALRCIGWDEESWKIWSGERNKRLRIAN